jgi:hypothetical protein
MGLSRITALPQLPQHIRFFNPLAAIRIAPVTHQDLAVCDALQPAVVKSSPQKNVGATRRPRIVRTDQWLPVDPAPSPGWLDAWAMRKLRRQDRGVHSD